MTVSAEPDTALSRPLPFSLAVIGDRLADFRPPETPFEMDGEWEHRYTIWIALKGGAGNGRDAGALRILCKPRKNAIDLSVTQLSRIAGRAGRAVTRAEIECAVDKLTPPRKWTVDSAILVPDGTPLAAAG